MTIHAFKMQLKPGVVDEYRRRHDEIWPELSALLSDSGIYDYSIFLDEDTLSLFAVLKLRADNSRDALPDHPVMKRWWDYMAVGAACRRADARSLHCRNPGARRAPGFRLR